MKLLTKITAAVVGLGTSALVMAQTASPEDALFAAIETRWEALEPKAYALMGVILTGLIIMKLVKKVSNKAT